jgi:branched-chain amino acid aminotransferase
MRCWVNGRLLESAEEAAIPIIDHGWTVGDGVFEAVKVAGGHPFALTRHLDRLAVSAQGLGLPAPDLDEVRRGVAAVVPDDLELGRIRITWTAGPAPLGSGRGSGRPTLAVAAGPMTARPDDTGIVTVPWTRNEHGALAGLKTTSYGENVVALAWAHEQGATEAILANTAGNLCEGTGSNIFYVVDGELRTPTLASGCLAGVTRALVLEWVGAREMDEPVGVLADADEIFVTSTTRDVQAVTRCDGRELTVGPVTRAAMQTWASRAAEGIDP